MFLPVTVFKNELKKSYNENLRLKSNLEKISSSKIFKAGHCFLKVLNFTAKSTEFFLSHFLSPLKKIEPRVSGFFTKEVKLPFQFEINYKIPQYYGGLNKTYHLKKFDKKDYEEYISYFEEEVIPFIFTNLENNSELSKVLIEENLHKIKKFKEEIKDKDEILNKIRCVDIKNVESRIENYELITKFQCRIINSYFKTGCRKREHKIYNLVFAFKSNHNGEEESYPEISDIQYEVMQYQ